MFNSSSINHPIQRLDKRRRTTSASLSRNSSVHRSTGQVCRCEPVYQAVTVGAISFPPSSRIIGSTRFRFSHAARVDAWTREAGKDRIRECSQMIDLNALVLLRSPSAALCSSKQVCKSPSPSLHSSAWKRIKSRAFSRCRNESKPSTCPYMHSLNNKSIKVPTYAKIRTTRCIWFCTRLRVIPYDVELTQRDLITRLNEFGRVITKFPASISEFPRNPMPSSTVRMCACTFIRTRPSAKNFCFQRFARRRIM